jgi:hypothetical protein
VSKTPGFHIVEKNMGFEKEKEGITTAGGSEAYRMQAPFVDYEWN